MSSTPKDATETTARVNRDAVALYDLADRQDFADADRNLIAPLPGQVVGADGHVIFDPAWMDYITDDADAPDTVNPSLWRQSQVMRRGGLYQVTDRLYQVRNNDLANLTIVEGDDDRAQWAGQGAAEGDIERYRPVAGQGKPAHLGGKSGWCDRVLAECCQGPWRDLVVHQDRRRAETRPAGCRGQCHSKGQITCQPIFSRPCAAATPSTDRVRATQKAK